MARDKQFTHVILPRIAFLWYNALNSNMDPSGVGFVVMDIEQAAMTFTSLSFKRVRWHCNVVAQVLANSCKNSSLLCVFHSVSDCIQKTMYDFIA